MNEKTIPRVITDIWLEQRGACESQILRFGDCFGRKAEVTRENLELADVSEIDVCFLSSTFPDDVWTEYRARKRAAFVLWRNSKYSPEQTPIYKQECMDVLWDGIQACLEDES